MIRIKHSKTFFGPNIFSPFPVILINVETDRDDIEKTLFSCQKLEEIFPDYYKDMDVNLHSSELVVANYLSLWAFGALNEVRGFIRDRGVSEAGGAVYIWIGYHHELLSLQAIMLGCYLINSISSNEKFSINDVKSILLDLEKKCRYYHPDFQARILMDGAVDLNIPFFPVIGQMRAWQFGWGENSMLFFESSSNSDGYISGLLSNNKSASKVLFKQLGAPIAKHALVREERQLLDAANEVGFPCVVKPLDSGGGKGVSVGLNDYSQLDSAFKFAKRFGSGHVMIESFVEGDVYRIIVINGQMKAAIKRSYAKVVGDGVSTVKHLIDQINTSRTKNLHKSNYLYPININQELISYLKRQGVSLDYVLTVGQRVDVSLTANLHAGGHCEDVYSLVHDDVRLISEALAKSMGIYAAGIDYITPDISKSWHDVSSAFIEINLTPGLSSWVSAGVSSRSVGEMVLGNKIGRIPVCVTIVNDHCSKLIQDFLNKSDLSSDIGWLFGKNRGVGKLKLTDYSTEGWEGVLSILQNKTIKKAFFAVSLVELIEKGFPVDVATELITYDIDLDDNWKKVLTASSCVWYQAKCEDELIDMISNVISFSNVFLD